MCAVRSEMKKWDKSTQKQALNAKRPTGVQTMCADNLSAKWSQERRWSEGSMRVCRVGDPVTMVIEREPGCACLHPNVYIE